MGRLQINLIAQQLWEIFFVVAMALISLTVSQPHHSTSASITFTCNKVSTIMGFSCVLIRRQENMMREKVIAYIARVDLVTRLAY